jgi:AcrR family transcriptional regulator
MEVSLTTPAVSPPTTTNARPRILAAAFDCFCEFGYEKSSMKRIAARAGVSQPLLHHHFATKERLLESAISEMTAGMFATAFDQLSQPTSVAEVLDAAAELLYAMFVDNLRAATFMVEFTAAANHNDFLKEAYLDFQQTQRQNVVRFIEALFPEVDTEVAVELVETFVLGMAMRRPFTTDQSLFRVGFDAHVRLLINHLMGQGTEHLAQ